MASVEAVFSPQQQLPTPSAPRMESDEMPVLHDRRRGSPVFTLAHVPDRRDGPGRQVAAERDGDGEGPETDRGGVQMPRDATLSRRDRLNQLKFGDSA